MTYKPTDSMLSVRDAAFHTVHAYPGGAAALAIRLGVSHGVLCHKVKPNWESRHHLTLEEAVKMQQLAGDYRILHAMARECGHVAVQTEGVDSEAINTDITNTVREFAEYLKSVTTAVSDNKVTDNELRDVDQHLGDLVAQANHLRACLAAMNQTLKAAAPVSLTEKISLRQG